MLSPGESEGTPSKTERIDFQRAAPETIALPSVPEAAIILENSVEIPLVGKDIYWIGRADPVNSWFPEIDLAPYGGEPGGVSRQHGRIIYEGSSFFLEDYQSKNGSFVNDVKVQGRTGIAAGDRLKFGRVQVTFSI